MPAKHNLWILPALLFLWTIPGRAQEASTFTLTPAIAGSDFSYQIKIEGGMPPFVYAVKNADSLPEGITLDKATGKLSGRPSTPRLKPYEFLVEVTDAFQPPGKVQQAFSLQVRPAQIRIVLDTAAANSPTPAAAVSEVKPPPPPAPILARPILAGDESIRGIAYPSKPGETVLVELERHGKRLVGDLKPNPESGEFVFKVPEKTSLTADEEIVARQRVNGVQSAASAPVTVEPLNRTGEQARAIVGFQQAGASGAKSDQKFFFDFYISRPVPGFCWRGCGRDKSDDSPVRWWGNVQISSVPQQVSSPVGQFVTEFGTHAAAVKVNEMAEGAEFVSGLEFRLPTRWIPVLGQSEQTRQRFRLGLFFGAGATGVLEPKKTLQIFETPAANSPERDRFLADYPHAAQSQYVGFVAPDRERFYRQYFAGIRLTTHYAERSSTAPLISPPAMVSVAFGQNELVTAGRLWGMVSRIDAFYPLPIKARDHEFSGIYLFGSVALRLHRATNVSPYVLKPAPDSVNGYDPSVALIPVAGARDIYRIGAGIDLVRLIQIQKSKNEPKKTEQ